MRRTLFFILLIGCFAGSAQAVQKEPSPRIPPRKDVHLRYRLTGTAGWLNRDDKIIGTSQVKGLTMDRPVVVGGTFAVEFMPMDRNLGLRRWNNTSVGVALTVLDLGQQQYLGQVIAPHAYVNVPLVRKPHFEFGLRPGLGVAFVTKTYANTVPDEYRWNAYTKNGQQIANVSIGSIANAWITAGVYVDVPIKKGWSFAVSAAWQHVSNGSVMTPNAGYNMFNGEMGLVYSPETNPGGHYYVEPMTIVPHELYEGVKKKWDVEIGLAGGCRSVYYRDREWFGVGSFTVAAHWQPVSIFRLGGGVDVFYDGAYRSVCDKLATPNTTAPITYFGKTYLAESKVSNCFRVGISLQPEMVLGNLTFGYHLGIYLYDPVKNLEPYKEAEKGLDRGIFYKYDPMKASTYQDGWFYQKLQLKYLCTKHLYVQLGLKLHIMKAEFIDAGLGIRI
ncbi:MAG: acyloxyacyl hydrolase [Paludibacteraceae bacterium]|nr:acyloxyacyl hydrolase [Paludibacteraceae bacterium]